LNDFRGTVLFTSRDHELVETIANRVIEIGPKGMLDKEMDFDTYINSDAVAEQRQQLFGYK
jgi:ATPase subunit of ABC transporter with duplicated ATPase domains